jgi:hypothetical protein
MRSASTRYLRLVLVSSPFTRSPGERWLISCRKLLARSTAALAMSTPARFAAVNALASRAAAAEPPAKRTDRRRRRPKWLRARRFARALFIRFCCPVLKLSVKDDSITAAVTINSSLRFRSKLKSKQIPFRISCLVDQPQDVAARQLRLGPVWAFPKLTKQLQTVPKGDNRTIMMQRILCLALIGLAAPAATAGSSSDDADAPRVTSKPADQFVACFASAQDRAARPWSFVPRENGGGTLSNVGAKGVSKPYFVKVADLGSRREIRIESASASAGAPILRAVDSCV